MQLADSSYADDNATQESTNQEATTSEKYELQSHFSDETSCATCHEQLLQNEPDNMSNPNSRREVSPTTWPTEAGTDEMDLSTQLAESTCNASQQSDDGHTAQEAEQDATRGSAHQELLPSGLSWPTVVATAVEFSPVGVAIHCASPPQPHDSTDQDAHAIVVPRTLSSELVADYFDTLQMQPPTPGNDLPEGRDNHKIQNSKAHR